LTDFADGSGVLDELPRNAFLRAALAGQRLREHYGKESDQSGHYLVLGRDAQRVAFVGHIKCLYVFAGSFETPFQSLAAFRFPELVLKAVD
jgi:hypothetical protein